MVCRDFGKLTTKYYRKYYCDLTNNILIPGSVNLISYLIFDGEIDDKEFYRCNLRG